MINKQLGNEYESILIQLLASNGYWCHLFAYKPEGQPCDIIALKDNQYMLIDVKHCAEKRFSFNSIQVNQRNCFKLASQKGNTNNGFAIYFEQLKEWRWLDYCCLVKLEESGVKSVAPLNCAVMFGGKNEVNH